ncbi:uncharacterized protein LOC117906175 [Vitis riparia]|uniref:uncharacterized protein LOC117906175 n=1 Tax=Vitis riparia TaxID=96939 RepID=UPI00155A0DBB|nr:uncharacterized protein LOC117906175 [Vitis riparia]
MSIEPYHLGRYSSIGSSPDVRGALQESDDLVNHFQKVGPTFRGVTIQDEGTWEHYLLNAPIYSAQIQVASDGNGNEINTLVNVNEKNPEDDNQTPRTEIEVASEKNPEDDDQIPQKGMAFYSELEAEEFYKKYAKRIGFTVRKGKVRETRGIRTSRCFLCSCEGSRARKHSNQGTGYQRSETRTECKAQIQVKLCDGKWVITKLHLEHNHRSQCLDTLNWPSDEPNGPSDELEGALGADEEIQTSFAPTEAEDRDKTLTDPNTAAGLPEMVEGSELTFVTKELIWQKILAKHGDITATCSFEGPAVRTKLSEMAKDLTPEIVNLMQENTARSLSDEGFNFISKTLGDFERMHFNVDWLRRPFVASQPLIEYAQAERKRDVIRRRLNEKIAEVAQLFPELDQADASLQELQRRIPDLHRIEDTLGKRLL